MTNLSGAVRSSFYLNMIEKFNLTHLIEDEDNITHVQSVLEENFPWPPDMK